MNPDNPQTQQQTPQETPAPEQTTIAEVPVQEVEAQPEVNKGLLISAIFAGILVSVLGSFLYKGKYIIPGLILRLVAQKEENVSGTGVGFDYISDIYKIPKKVFENSAQINVLVIEYSHIGAIPKEVYKMGSLTRLQVKDSRLNKVDSAISNLNNLETLDLSGNKIKSVPASIGGLSSLKNLSLANNKVSVLPQEIGNLNSLVSLDLHGNRLKSLPPGIANLSQLKFLYLGDNNITKEEQAKISGMLPNTLIYF